MKIRRTFGWLILPVVLAAGIFFWLRDSRPGKTSPLAGPVPTADGQKISPAGAAARVPAALELARRAALFASFQKHPFTAARETAAFGWTAEDGKNPGVIRQLAHNELEFQRMAEESARIYRRQLVYHKETADLLLERAKLNGQPVPQLILPGLDGQQIQFEITKTDLSPSGQQGAFSGRVAGRLDSMVTFAFKGGREAFTILSPSDGLYLVGEPREPGELIVKSINLTNYVVGTCGNP